MITVLDFEFNQAFDFGSGNSEPNPDCRFEIIQIGAVKLDDDYNILDKFSADIKPQLYKRIHPFVEKITGLTTDYFKDAKNFNEVYKDFRKF
ncbi:MAG: exonuclease domain-containing protein, partial [Lachnospirales bacterium]